MGVSSYYKPNTIAPSDCAPGKPGKGGSENGNPNLIAPSEYSRIIRALEEVEYYLCGPPMMIKAVTEMLLALGAPRENIMFDDFG